MPGDFIHELVMSDTWHHGKVGWHYGKPHPVVEILYRGETKKGRAYVSFSGQWGDMVLRHTAKEGDNQFTTDASTPVGNMHVAARIARNKELIAYGEKIVDIRAKAAKTRLRKHLAPYRKVSGD